MQKTSSILEEYEAFPRRVIPVKGAETLAEMSKHQETVLGETLADLWEEIRSYEGITNEMIKGAWDVTTHIHPVDGSFRFRLAAERFVSNENSLLGESRSILPPPGGF